MGVRAKGEDTRACTAGRRVERVGGIERKEDKRWEEESEGGWAEGEREKRGGMGSGCWRVRGVAFITRARVSKL